MMSTSRDNSATLSSKFSIDTTSLVSQLEICAAQEYMKPYHYVLHAFLKGGESVWWVGFNKKLGGGGGGGGGWCCRLTVVSNLLSLRRLGEAFSFFSSFIQEASTSSEGWMARKYSDWMRVSCLAISTG